MIGELFLYVGGGLLVWLYVGYPVVTFTFARFRKPTSRTPLSRPSVAVLIIAYNEKAVIAKKLQNTLALHYAPGKKHIVVVDSGSTDGMREEVEKFTKDGVQYLNQEQREGKASAIHFGAQRVSTDLILSTDANAYFAPDALEHMVSYFADPTIGGVTAAMRQAATTGQAAEAESERYWKYERYIRSAEARLASVCNLSGEAALFRRETLSSRELSSWYPAGTADDLSLSVALVRAGFRLAYAVDADVWEVAPATYHDYFKQKVRIVVQTIATVFASLPTLLLKPSGYSYWVFPNRKVLPLLSPLGFLFMLFGVASVAWPFALVLLGLYGVLLTSRLLHSSKGVIRAGAQAAALFGLLNVAVVLGWIQFFSGKRYTVWDQAASTRSQGAVR